MARILNVIFVIFIGGLIVWIVQLNHRIVELSQEIKEAKSHTAPTVAAINQGSSSSQQSSSPTNVIAAHSSITSTLSKSAEPDEQRAIAWRVEWQLGEIDKRLALSDSQREALRSRLQDDFTLQQSSPQKEADLYSEQSAITEALGEDLAKAYEGAVAKERLDRQEKEIETQLFTLSRKLNLSSAQEGELQQALRQANQVTQPIRDQIAVRMRAAMRSHSGSSKDKESLQARYDEIKALNDQLDTAKAEIVREQMQGKLTDQQMNQLMEETVE